MTEHKKPPSWLEGAAPRGAGIMRESPSAPITGNSELKSKVIEFEDKALEPRRPLDNAGQQWLGDLITYGGVDGLMKYRRTPRGAKSYKAYKKAHEFAERYVIRKRRYDPNYFLGRAAREVQALCRASRKYRDPSEDRCPSIDRIKENLKKKFPS